MITWLSVNSPASRMAPPKSPAPFVIVRPEIVAMTLVAMVKTWMRSSPLTVMTCVRTFKRHVLVDVDRSTGLDEGNRAGEAFLEIDDPSVRSIEDGLPE